MQTKTRINIIVGVALLFSLLGNIAFIHQSIYNNRQARQSSERIEHSIADTSSLVNAATGLVESGNKGLGSVATGLSASTDTAGAITDNANTSLERCSDIEQTIKELRAEITNMENDCNNSSSSSSGSNSDVDNH